MRKLTQADDLWLAPLAVVLLFVVLFIVVSIVKAVW
jgi:hypothetical protein